MFRCNITIAVKYDSLNGQSFLFFQTANKLKWNAYQLLPLMKPAKVRHFQVIQQNFQVIQQNLVRKISRSVASILLGRPLVFKFGSRVVVTLKVH